MNMTQRTCRAAVTLAIVLVSASTHAVEPLRLLQTIPLGVEGRIDHLAIDPDGQRLFVAALGNNTVEIVDLATGKAAHSIAGLKEPQGIAFLKNQGLIAVANSDDGTCRFFDAKSMLLTDTIDFHSDADNVRYDQTNERLYVGFGDGAIGVMDVVGRKRLPDIKLSAHPESFQLETKGNRIFVNVPQSREIAVVDRKQAAVIATWPVKEAQANFPMALDEGNHRLFVGCRAPAEVLVYDTQSGKISDRFSCVGDADELFYNDRTRRLYVVGGAGLITVHQQNDGGKFSQLAKIPTAPGARTALLAPNLARLYLAVPRRGSQAAELRVYEVVP